MGHADRPRLHNAFSVDAQSRRIRLPSARRWESDTNPHRVAECYGNSDGYADSNSNSDGYADSHCDSNGDTTAYTHTESCTDAEAASYAATPAIARN